MEMRSFQQDQCPGQYPHIAVLRLALHPERARKTEKREVSKESERADRRNPYATESRLGEWWDGRQNST